MQRTAYELRISDWSSYVSSSDLLGAVESRLKAARRLGPVAQLMPTTAATTIRKSREPVVLDGPFAETKEQLLGFIMVECESLEHAIETAKELARANARSEEHTSALQSLMRNSNAVICLKKKN